MTSAVRVDPNDYSADGVAHLDPLAGGFDGGAAACVIQAINGMVRF
jgi:hypothetical protein